MNHRVNSVVVFLYDDNDSYLFQLRDDKPTIIFPNHWGLFGGEINEDETPLEAVSRELEEEIQYIPEKIYEFRQYRRQDVLRGQLLDYCIHAYYGKRTVSLSQLVLREGADFGVFSIDEILTGQLFSKKWNDYFPVIPPLMSFFHEYLQWRSDEDS